MSEPATEHIDQGIAVSDAEAIRSAVRAIPNVDQRIISMHRETSGTVSVRTGIIFGPRAGHGQLITVAPESGGWKVKKISVWMA